MVMIRRAAFGNISAGLSALAVIALSTSLPVGTARSMEGQATKSRAAARTKDTVPASKPSAPSAAVPAVPVGQGPKPIGNPGEWFPADSYPEAAKVAAQEGRTDFSLEIDAKGHIMTCNIVNSSGSELLDTTTCSQLILNGRFEPARDAQGRAVAGRWESAMRWRLLEQDTPEE